MSKRNYLCIQRSRPAQQGAPVAGSYLWAAVQSDLHCRCGNADSTRQYRDAALESAPSSAVKELLNRRLNYQTKE